MPIVYQTVTHLPTNPPPKTMLGHLPHYPYVFIATVGVQYFAHDSKYVMLNFVWLSPITL